MTSNSEAGPHFTNRWSPSSGEGGRCTCSRWLRGSMSTRRGWSRSAALGALALWHTLHCMPRISPVLAWIASPAASRRTGTTETWWYFCWISIRHLTCNELENYSSITHSAPNSSIHSNPDWTSELAQDMSPTCALQVCWFVQVQQMWWGDWWEVDMMVVLCGGQFMAISVQATLLSTSEKELVGVWGGVCSATAAASPGNHSPTNVFTNTFLFYGTVSCLPIPRSHLTPPKWMLSDYSILHGKWCTCKGAISYSIS